MAELPVTDPDMIAGLQADWESENRKGSSEATQAAFRCAQAHSLTLTDMQGSICITWIALAQTRVGACALKEGCRPQQRLGICGGIAARQVDRCSGSEGPRLSHSCCNVQAWEGKALLFA